MEIDSGGKVEQITEQSQIRKERGMRKSKKAKTEEEIRKLIEVYFEGASKEDVFVFRGYIEGMMAKKKLGCLPSLKGKI